MAEIPNGILTPEPEPKTVEISVGTVFKLRRDENQRGLILDPRSEGDYFGFSLLQVDERLRKFWLGEIENGNKRDIVEIVAQMTLDEILAAAEVGEEKYGNPISPKLLVEIRSRARQAPRVLTLR